MMECGLSRRDAISQAREMAGVPLTVIRLPAIEFDLIRLAERTVGKWQIAPSGALMGFDLREIDVARDWMGIEKSEALLTGLGIIERAALKVLGDT